MTQKNQMEEYIKPEMDVIDISKENAILTSSGSGDCENYYYYPWKNYAPEG